VIVSRDLNIWNFQPGENCSKRPRLHASLSGRHWAEKALGRSMRPQRFQPFIEGRQRTSGKRAKSSSGSFASRTRIEWFSRRIGCRRSDRDALVGKSDGRFCYTAPTSSPEFTGRRWAPPRQSGSAGSSLKNCRKAVETSAGFFYPAGRDDIEGESAQIITQGISDTRAPRRFCGTPWSGFFSHSNPRMRFSN